jgi:hypothetical protein
MAQRPRDENGVVDPMVPVEWPELLSIARHVTANASMTAVSSIMSHKPN